MDTSFHPLLFILSFKKPDFPGGLVESRPELQPGELRLSATKAVVLASEWMAQTLCPRTMTKPLTSKGEHQGGAESNSSPIGTAARAEAGRL